MLRKVYLDKDENIDFSWKNLFTSFIFLLGNKRKKYLILLSFLFIVQFYSIVPPFVLGKIVDFFTNYKNGDPLTEFYFYTIFLGGSFSLVAFIRLNLKKTLSNLRSDITYETRVRGFEKLVNISLLETQKETTGEKVTKIQNGTGAIRTLTHMMHNELFSSIASTTGIFIVFVFLNITYTLFMFIYIVGFFTIIKFFYSRIQKLNYEYNIAMEKSGGSYVEGLSNILTIKSLGAKKSFSKHIANKENIRREYEYKIRNYSNGQWQTYQVFNGICIGVFLYLIGGDVVRGIITLGSIVIFFGYLQRLTGNAGDILTIYEDLIEAKTAIARMMPIFRSISENRLGTKSFPKNWDYLKLENASFEYKQNEKDESKVGIKNINLVIKRGDKVGIVGKSGSGKSTLAKILIGLYPIDSGKYEINSSNFYDIYEEKILKKISLVLQETEMFNLPVGDNITLMKKLNHDLFVNAVETSQLNSVIEELPQKIDTLIGEKGYHLSGGERQRVGIARAVYKNPQILILDEATSSLDTKTEKKIQEGLEKMVNKTLVIIAHRVSTLKDVDRIYVMENGRIIESGKYAELINNPNSNFYQIYESQQKKEY